MDKVYAAIDLKSFYASVECVELGLDPLNTNLVVADKSCIYSELISDPSLAVDYVVATPQMAHFILSPQ